MAKPGLSFENPLFADSSGTPAGFANPYTGLNPAASSGSDALQRGLADIALMGQTARGQLQTQFSMPGMTTPAEPREAEVLFDSAARKFYVNGVEIGEDDDASILRSEALLDQPSVGAPPSGNWVRVPTETYRGFIEEIRNPSIPRLASKSFGRGVDVMQLLAGRGLQFAGAEELGGRIVAQQERELAQTAPYERQFTDIGTEPNRGVLDWFVANLAQQGPNIVESAVTAALGAVAGGLAGGGPNPFTAAGGALAALAGKESVKQATLAAARKYAQNKALTAAETKLLHEMAGVTAAANIKNGVMIGRAGTGADMMTAAQAAVGEGAAAAAARGLQQARIGGAGLASLGQNYATGIADVYGETIEAGDPSRAVAAAMGLPYAALESLSEFALAKRVFGVGKPITAPVAATTRGRAGELLKKAGAGFAVGGLTEGTTETGQEALLLGANRNVDWDSPEGLNRLVNSFAAGFGVGGPVGAVANLVRREPANILDPAQNPEPTPGAEINRPAEPPPTAPTGTGLVPVTPAPTAPAAGPGTAVEPYYAPATFAGVIPAPPAQLAGPANVPQLPGPVQPVTPMGGPVMAVTPEGVVYPDQMLRQTGNVPPGAPGTQGVLDIFGGQISAQELAARMQPPMQQLALPAPAPTVSPAQGALQFAGPAPTGPVNTQMASQLQAIQAQVQRQREFEAAQAQQQAAMQQQMDMLAQQSQNARDLFIMQQAQQAAAAQPTMPMREAGPVAPRQLELFTRREAPRPSRAEGLRRGVGTQVPPVVGETPLTPAQERAQLALFTREGQPTVAALKAAGKKTKLPPAPAKARATKTAGARGLKRQAGVAAIEIVPKEKPSAAQEGKLKQGRVEQREKDNEGVRAGRKAGEQPKAQVPAGGAQAGGRGVALKRGAQQEKVAEAPPPKKVEAAPAAAPAAPVKVEALPPAEAWEDRKPEGAPTFENLPPAVRTQWAKDVAAGKATMQRAIDILGEKELPSKEVVQDAIYEYEGNGPVASRLEALKTIVHYAFFAGRGTNEKPAAEMAEAYFAGLQLLDSEREAVNAFVIDSTREKALYARYKGGVQEGERTPWFNYAEQNGLLEKITQTIINLNVDEAQGFLKNGQLRAANLPDDTIKKIKNRFPDFVTGNADTNPKNDTRANPATQLSNEIKRINTHTGVPFNPTARKRATDKLRNLFVEAKAAGMEDFIDQNGDVISSYFDEDGNPYVGTVNGQFRVATEEITAEVQRTRERIIKESQMAEDDDYEAPFNVDDWNIRAVDDSYDDGRYFRDDGTPITKAIPMGRVKMLVNGFLSKLGTKPKVFIYRDQADFKAKNPSLYAKAVASRPQGDFDTASAVGYSFGDGNVIIFAQRVATEQQLKFVLAHETLGHFGFRGLLTERQLGAALDAVYNSSAKVKNAVDAAMQARKMSRREATEEYLADFAGMLDTNIIAKFWNAIKNALNKLGVRFDDDMARYLVSQSRRYVRNGAPSSSFVNFKAIAQRIGAIEGMNDPDGSGRFALAGEYYDEINRVAASNAFGQRSFKLFDLTSLFQNLQDRGINLKDYGNRLIGELKSMNYAARENQGYRRLYDIFRDTSKAAAQLRAQYNKMMATVLSPAIELPGIGKVGNGATEEQIARTSAMLNVTSRVKLGDLTEAELRKLGSLIDIVDGEVRLNQAVFDALSARGKFTLDDFKKGIKYTVSVPRPMTDAQRTKLRAERDQELAAATSDKERKAIEAEYQKRIDAPSYLEEVEQSFDPIPDLTEQSLEWVMYNEVRDTMNQSSIDMLLANFAAAKGERDNVERIVRDFLGRALTENDVAFLKKVEDKYLALRAEGSSIDASGVLLTKKESVDHANDFIKKFNTAVLGLATDRNAKVQEFFDKAEADDVFNGIEALKKDSNIPRSGDKQFTMQQAIQNLALFELSKTDAELHAKRSIAGGYVPFGREGAWQVRIQAVDPTTGRVFKISDRYRQQLLYAQVENRAEAEAMSTRVQGLLDEVEGGFEMEVLDGAEYVIKKVKLVAQPETARETVSTTAEANLNEIVSAITRFSISITPEERERLIVGLTQQNAKARSRLKRAGTPGEDPNTIKYVSQHLESTASTVARKQNRHRLDRLFDDGNPESEQLWRGDKLEYDRRKAVWEAAQNDPNMPEAQRLAAKREFDDYHYTFVTKESPIMGNRFKDRGRRAVAFMESQSNVDYTDFASGEAASVIRTATTFGFMGASFATAILNYLSLATNVLPAFSGYNAKNAFGGGFGWGMSSVEVSRAIGATKGFGQSEVKFWDDLLADPAKLKASGFTEAEARFMQKEVGGGTMQAALTNSLLGSARGKFRSGATKTAAETWMSLFNYTEQHSRRATGLAAFRMAYARALQEGKDAATAFEVADKFAVDMIDNTLGEYAMYNRPAMFRGDVRQFLFMFKMFPVNSIQMLASLPRKEQLLALGILAMFAGLKGLPFAEDLMDIIDTIAQGLGLGPSALWKGSSERTLAEALDAIAPGMTPVLLRGLLNTITPANVADRISLSNIVPGTGIGLAGADIGRELIEVAGPVASFLQGAVTMAGDLAKWGIAQPLGIAADTTSMNSIMRESPIAFLRILGDMVAYDNAGAIVSRKGYVVSEDLHLGTMLTRALGFYPSAAVAENDVVRVAKRVTDYQKDIAATYRGMYISAKIAKDNERAQEVVQMVRDWNAAAKGSGLELRNFEASANRALREAQRPATERFLRTQPIAARSATEDLLRLYGVGEE